MTLKNAGMYQVSLYTALIKNMFRVITCENVKLKEYYGKKTIDLLKEYPKAIYGGWIY